MSNDDEEEVRRREEARRLPDDEVSMAVLVESHRPEEGRPSQEDAAELARRLQIELANERRLRQESERQVAEERRRFQESESLRLAQVAEERRLRNGTYYSEIDQVWGTKPMDYDSPVLFEALRRERPPNFTRSYSLTRRNALNRDFVAVENSTRSSSASNNSTWPKDIFGIDRNGADIAHLIPHSHSKASLFFDVVTWAFGFTDDVQWNSLQKAIHGTFSNETGGRMAHTGIKHSVPNKIRLAGQVQFYDRDPCVLIIPILTLHEMKRWNGEGYNAIVMCGSIKDESDPPRVVIRASTVCQTIRMIADGPIASASQIEKARLLLEHVLLGMAHSLLRRFQGRWNELLAADDLRSSFQSLTGIQKLIVPDAKASTEQLKVRVVEFYGYGTLDGHPAPDPLLLSVKAAINWSRRHKQPLRAAGERPEEEDELDVLAEELYGEELKRRHRPQTWDDLARGLGQPYGYQGVDGVST
jgi:hypothetical protein